MSTQEKAIKGQGFEFCQSLMEKCCHSGATGEKAGKYDFKSCEKVMKKFCGAKDGKFDFAACQSKIEQFCKLMKKESNDHVTK